MAISSLLGMFLPVRQGFVYTISADIYAFCLVFSTILPCVLHQNALQLASKRTAFSIKTHCIQHQNAMRFAPYCTIFGHKRPQKGCKCRPFEINIHFVAFTHGPFLASKQTFARIDFLRQVGRLGTKWVLMALNFLLKILLFCTVATFCNRQMGLNFGFQRIFVQYFVPERSGCLGFVSQR